MPSINISPLHYLLRRISRQDISITAKAIRVFRVTPPSSVNVIPPIYLDDEMDRVLSITRWSNKRTEDNRLFGKEIHYPASEIFELQNATIVDWNIYHKGTREWQHEKTSFKPFYFSNFESFEEAILCSTLHRNQFFGHWLTDQLPSELLANSYPATTISCASSKPFIHALEYRNLTSLFSQTIQRAKVKSLLLLRDIAHNKSRQDRLLKLREMISHKLILEDKSPIPLTFITRGQEGAKRELVNENKIRNWVLSLGGLVIEPEKMKVEDIHKSIGTSACILGVEGSNLTHALMLAPEDATIIVIQPPTRFHNILKTYTDVIGQRYAFTVAENNADGDGFMLPISRLKSLYNKILQQRS